MVLNTSLLKCIAIGTSWISENSHLSRPVCHLADPVANRHNFYDWKIFMAAILNRVYRLACHPGVRRNNSSCFVTRESRDSCKPTFPINLHLSCFWKWLSLKRNSRGLLIYWFLELFPKMHFLDPSEIFSLCMAQNKLQSTQKGICDVMAWLSFH